MVINIAEKCLTIYLLKTVITYLQEAVTMQKIIKNQLQKKWQKTKKGKKTPKSKGNGKKKAKQGPMGAPLFDGKAAGGGRTILNNEQWHGLISTGISESMDANMKNQEEKRSKWRKVANEAGLEVKQAIAAWKKLRHLGRQAAIACHIEKNKRRRSGSGNDIHEEDEEALFLENFKCPANVSVISKQPDWQKELITLEEQCDEITKVFNQHIENPTSKVTANEVTAIVKLTKSEVNIKLKLLSIYNAGLH